MVHGKALSGHVAPGPAGGWVKTCRRGFLTGIVLVPLMDQEPDLADGWTSTLSNETGQTA